MLTVLDAPLQNKHVLLVADFNVALNNNDIVNTYKIDQTLPTIKYILESGCRSLTISTHLGRPKNRDECSVDPVFKYLSTKVNNLQYEEISNYIKSSSLNFTSPSCHGRILELTDNSRYYSETDLENFYKKFDLIVNDAFGCAHRKAPFKSYAGFLMEKEINNLELTKKSDLVIMGGAKISDKLQILETFNATIFVGGCLGQTILKSLGYEMGDKSRVEKYDNHNILNRLSILGHDDLVFNRDSAHKSCQTSAKIYLPSDFLVIEDKVNYKLKGFDGVGIHDECIDVGPKTMSYLGKLIKKSNLIFWNGPSGKIEDENAVSTKKLVEMLENSHAKVVCGGGETLCAVQKYSKIKNFEHVSTGGGAMLQMLNGGDMPGIASILK